MLAQVLIAGWLALQSASGQSSGAQTPPSAVAPQPNSAHPDAALWIAVPFVPQTTDGCGSATLAMVIRYWQQARHEPATADAEAIQQQLFNRRAHGIYASRMVEYLRQSGFAAFAFHGEWSDLEHHVALGRPLIVALRDGGAHGPLHYVVVVGVSDDAVYVNDPARRRMLHLARAGFLKAWSATDDWTLLATPHRSVDHAGA